MKEKILIKEFKLLANGISNLVSSFINVFSNEKTVNFFVNLNDYNMRLYDKEHVERISKLGWTINYFTARINNEFKYDKEFEDALYLEYKREDSLYPIDEIIGAISSISTGNLELLKQLEHNLKMKNYDICLSPLVMMIEREVRLTSGQINSHSYKVIRYFKKQYDKDNKKIREYSMYVYLKNIFFKNMSFKNVNYNTSINRNVMQHGFYELDYISELYTYQLLNVLITLSEINKKND